MCYSYASTLKKCPFPVDTRVRSHLYILKQKFGAFILSVLILVVLPWRRDFPILNKVC